ncbi:outer membrane protein with beta-barrel domain [Pontibacter ummariensis]|uniref:Outer membrane protein beta-barrel domain-containing protein n=1 Tax=Pontibacter ummariensis TaxID=1610492 RepID=A0A239JXC5_9BACT|nr:porin family protein [Pontibacter ummariensis]PRY07303.1 outer membrane protein with beta-barrel domain [Pontibacter ummariensis]SNT10073.1 Outer membrane protein beta-barrel domain-containing protein [Pontibacter ummariensis]
MKKLFIACALLLGTISAAQAQATFGVRGGANLSNLSGDLRDEEMFENKLSFHAGVLLNFPVVEDFFSIQPELLYSRRGFKSSGEEYTNLLLQTRRREGSVNYAYLDLPVLANIKAGPLYFELGPQLSYLLSVNNETEIYDGSGNRIASSRDEKSKDGLSEFEIGYAAGLGVTSRNGISLGLRYNGAFSDFVKDADYFEGDLANARHSVFMLTLGIKFSATE